MKFRSTTKQALTSKWTDQIDKSEKINSSKVG